MATFFMFGKYSSESLRGISEDRTKKTKSLIERAGGKLNSIYIVLGKYDVVMIVELPDIETAMKVSIMLNKLSEISFTTLPALPVEKFDAMAGDLQ